MRDLFLRDSEGPAAAGRILLQPNGLRQSRKLRNSAHFADLAP